MFETEQGLVDAFQPLACAFLRKVYGRPVSRHFALREFDSHYGVADIVLGKFRPHLSARCPRKSINHNWIDPLYQLSDGTVIQLDTYADQFGVSRRTARLQIQEYVEANFVKPLGNDTFQVLRTYESIVTDVVSIEAKLRDWNQALTQALRYRRFSDYVFVLLDDDGVWPALERMDLFERENIGLVSLENGDTELNFHFIPDRISKKRDCCSNRLSESAYSYFLKAYAIA